MQCMHRGDNIIIDSALSKQSINHYGAPRQILKAIEELLELSCELSCAIEGQSHQSEYQLTLLRRNLNSGLEKVRKGIPVQTYEDQTYDDWMQVLNEVGDVYIILEHLKNIINEPEQLQYIISTKETRLKRQIAHEIREKQCVEMIE